MPLFDVFLLIYEGRFKWMWHGKQIKYAMKNAVNYKSFYDSRIRVHLNNTLNSSFDLPLSKIIFNRL
jgi:hypothetical protein